MPPPVHLHRRDLAILQQLAERHVDTLATLHAQHFAPATRKTARNRLARLVTAGFLRRVDTETLDASGQRAPQVQSAYLLGPRAHVALRLRSLATDGLHGPRRPATALAHQLAVNQVADWLGARLVPEHETSGVSRHRADGAYRAAPDAQGRDLVLLEVDLGHYSRQRVLGKLAAFLAHPEAAAIVIATPSWGRAMQVGRWAREAHGDGVMERVHPLTFEQLRQASVVPTHLRASAL